MGIINAYRFNELCKKIARIVSYYTNAESAFDVVSQGMSTSDVFWFWKTAAKVSAYSAQDVCVYGKRLGNKACTWLVMP